MFVFLFVEGERSEGTCKRNPHRILCHPLPWTDAATTSKRCDAWVENVWVEGTVGEEISVRVEGVGVRIVRFVVKNCPGSCVLMKASHIITNARIYQLLMTTMEPFGMKYPL